MAEEYAGGRAAVVEVKGAGRKGNRVVRSGRRRDMVGGRDRRRRRIDAKKYGGG